jgi:hypothetical protein
MYGGNTIQRELRMIVDNVQLHSVPSFPRYSHPVYAVDFPFLSLSSFVPVGAI